MTALGLVWGMCSCCGKKDWCSLEKINLNHEYFDALEGVYIIWSGKDAVIRIGSGHIRNEVNAHRADLDITRFPELHVTWAKVDRLHMAGIKKYLTANLKPLVTNSITEEVEPLIVNIPPNLK